MYLKSMRGVYIRVFKDSGKKGDYRDGKIFVNMAEMSTRTWYRRG